MDKQTHAKGDAMEKEKVLYLGTVVYPMRDGKILKGFKTKKIGKNCWMGWGGGFEEDKDATLEHCAIRETKEETGGEISDNWGLDGNIDSLEKIAIVDFHNITEDGFKFITTIHFYTLTEFTGNIHDTNTMINARWIRINRLPWKRMMVGDKTWLPKALLEGEKIYAKVYYGPRQKKLIKPTEIYPIDEYETRKAAQS